MVSLLERFKNFYWAIFEPFFPTVRDAWVAAGLIGHNVRQPYLYGHLKQGATRDDLRKLLEASGFEHDYVAWIDPDETLNMRKIVGVIYQYHVRLFIDGEVRGHYEYTAESHPMKHLKDIGMTDGRDYLSALLSPLTELLPEPALSVRNTTQGETSKAS